MKLERRYFNLGDKARAEVRAAGDDGDVFVGHAAVFNSPTEIWGFYEQVGESAFDRAIAGENDVRMLINHDPSLVLARSKNGEGTLTLSKDDVGLVSEAPLGGQTYARDLVETMERGDLDQMSFGFRTVQDRWEEKELELADGGTVTVQLRTLLDVDLYDVSPVTFPAYADTDAALRYLGLVPLERTLSPTLESKADPNQAELAQILRGLQELGELRAGKVLSRKNRDLVVAARDALEALLDAAGEDDEDKSTPVDVELRRLRLRTLEHGAPAL